MTRSTQNPFLTRFAFFTAFCTLALIVIGGLVTSHEAGMAVPDWPTTYGYNMFLFPFSKWVGGIFYEHSHRLVASTVGLLTTVLMVWLWLKEERKWLRWLGVAAFFAVGIQGLLGGLRVTLYKQEIGIFHATLAQMFFVLLCAIGLFTSRFWGDFSQAHRGRLVSKGLPFCATATALLILAQLALGASMRHQHAGLAVPDFPLAYGKIWPPMDDAFVDRINRSRVDIRDFSPVTGFQIGLHMAHRVTALAVLLAVSVVVWASRKSAELPKSARFLGNAWVLLIFTQAGLGIATVLSNKAADIATAHVAVGALSLAVGSVLSIFFWELAAAPKAKYLTRQPESSRLSHAAGLAAENR